MLLLWTSMAALAFKARRHDRLILVAAHLSFFLLNMATMPFWQVEGLALYGLLCGYTLFSARAAMLERSQAARGPAQRRRRVSRSGESPYSSRSIARQRR
jgi:Ca2+/Na+ antiporter